MKVCLNKKKLRDKIYACWTGKNIGGTMGYPYEGKIEMQDIQGFTTSRGEPLPNDDLDLQLVWLTAMEQVGPHALTANILSDYWLSYITPHWNEYGTCKSNLKIGLMPPLSGEFHNEVWKNSNGAWIRSEIWACLAPGFPNIAVKYAFMDASIDHGVSEGTYAEIFTAALESMAFVETDIRMIIEKALEFIPVNCRIAQSVKLVLEEYDKKTPWKKVRQLLVEQSTDIGWFQAPANIGYTVLGLIYGEGDFKKSMILSINCGDDTDCTAATCGAIMGIMGGTAGIPADWAEYIGDRIITVAVDASYKLVPKTCTELTNRVLELIPSVLKANGCFSSEHHGVYMEYTEDKDIYDKEAAFGIQYENDGDFMPEFSIKVMNELMAYGPYCFELTNGSHLSATVQYETVPEVQPLTDFNVKVHFRNHRPAPHHMELEVFLPEGWTAEYRRSVYMEHISLKTYKRASWEMTIHVGEHVEAVNKVCVWVNTTTYAQPLMIPMVFVG